MTRTALRIVALAVTTLAAIVASACADDAPAPTDDAAPSSATERRDDQEKQRGGSNTNSAATGRFVAVDAGYGHTCGLRDTGAIECWGWNSNGQADAPAGRFSAIAAGRFHTCGLREDREIECWGAASNPQGRFSTVSAGYEHSCAIRMSGEIECWGENADGQANAPSGSYRAVSAGGRHTCAIRSDGEIECWGASGYRIADIPELRFGDDPFTAVSAGESHACARSESGFVVCWGETSIPSGAGPAGSTYPFVAVGAGNANTCAVRATQHFAPDGGPPTEGDLVCWGWNEYGQAAPPPGSFTAVSVGGAHACALTPAGAIECWGANESGQLDAIGAPPVRRRVIELVETGAVEGKPQFDAAPALALEDGVDYRAVIELENGVIEIDLFEDDAPIHVNNFIFLVEREFYDGLTFHRVVPGFVAQGGDPTAIGTGGAGYTLPDELVADEAVARLTLDARGVISMARSGAGASSSQFFITLSPSGFLDEQSFTAFGEVTSGMELLDAFAERDPAAQPPDPAGPRIVSITIER